MCALVRRRHSSSFAPMARATAGAKRATVATCSGSDLQADLVARRTSAVAEAMEGAAVVHAARRLGVPAIEVRAISNTTGDRDQQQWNIGKALAALGDAVPAIIRHIAAD